MSEFIADYEEKSHFLETCDLPEEVYRIKPFVMVIFGGSGDLSQRKLLPTLFQLHGEGELPETFSVIAVGIPPLTDEEYRARMFEALRRFGDDDGWRTRWDDFAGHLYHVSGAFDEGATYGALKKKMHSMEGRCSHNVIYYLAVPPKVTPVIVGKLDENRLCKIGESAKIIIEKPFGRNLGTARELNTILRSAFDENQIYRIDHYLGKETVQNIIFFRFSNTIFERLWNSQYVDNVQITVAEEIGIEHRGTFYEQSGVVRDIVQNHLLQLLALVAMEPPIGFEADFIRDEKVKVFRSLRPMTGDEIDGCTVRGQYGAGRRGDEEQAPYRMEREVNPESMTPTFMAARLSIANWRWAGVPFYIRAGKRLKRRITEICIQFKQPPLRLFGSSCDRLDPNILVLTIQPDERIFLRFGVKYPRAANKIYPVNVDFRYRDVFSEKPQPPYGRLLVDCMKGDLTLFVRQDGVEAMWDFVDPIIARFDARGGEDLHVYDAGTWGPPEAKDLLERDGRRWHTG